MRKERKKLEKKEKENLWREGFSGRRKGKEAVITVDKIKIRREGKKKREKVPRNARGEETLVPENKTMI